MNNKQDIRLDESLPVYEAEIIEENDKNEVETFESAKPVVKKTSIVQKISKAVGAIAAVAGLLSEFKQYLPYLPSKKDENQTNKKQRRRMRSRG